SRTSRSPFSRRARRSAAVPGAPEADTSTVIALTRARLLAALDRLPPLRCRLERVLDALAKVPRFARARSLWALNTILDRLETASSASADEPLRHPPIFIVGPPRTGSTLLYQLVAARFDVGYLSNRHCRLYGAPSRVERRHETEATLELTSRYGRTTSPNAPSECAEY